MLQKKILEVIKYFDYFKFPITSKEVLQFLKVQTTLHNVEIELLKLTKNQLVFNYLEFYSISNKVELLSKNRKKKENKALKLLANSSFYSTILSLFPFVEGVAISGSLSKGVANDRSDIDFFVITKENRLWISRSLVQVFKNVLRVLGKEDFMCANYFKSSNNFPLEERTVFTEIELLTLIPVYNEKVFNHFYNINSWAFERYPNFTFPAKNNYNTHHMAIGYLFKYLLEFVLNCFGNPLDDFLFKKTKKRWTNAHLKKYNSFEDFDKSIKIRKNESKYHLSSYQSEVLKNI